MQLLEIEGPCPDTMYQQEAFRLPRETLQMPLFSFTISENFPTKSAGSGVQFGRVQTKHKNRVSAIFECNCIRAA